MRATFVASACIGAIGRLARLAPNAPHQLPLSTSHRTSRARRLIALVVLGTTGGVSSSCASRDSSLPLERMVVVIPVGNESPALYGIVRNLGTVDDSIVGVEVELAERAGLFSSREHLLPTDGAPAGALGNRSSEVSIAVRAGKTLRLSPDGLHALLSGLRRPLVRGDSTRVTLRFAHGTPRSAPVRVIAYADLDSILSPELSIEAVRNVAARFSAVHDEGHADSVVAPSADEGRVLYRANGCGACHGPDGEGDGPVGKTLRPPPRDFRDAVAFKNGTDVASIAQTIATGLMSGGAMPRFTHLTNSERASLALYVISLRNSTNSLKQLRDTL